MNPTPTPSLENLRLIEAACNDQLAPEQYAELESRLAADEALRRFYLEYSTLHAELYALAAADRAVAGVRRRLAEPFSVPPRTAELTPALRDASAVGAPRERFVSWIGRPWSFSLITASSCVFAIITALAIWRPDAPRARPQLPMPAIHAARGAAERAVGVAAAPQFPATAESTFLHAGEVLRVSSGKELQIVLGSGAEVMLFGPAEFVPETTRRGHLVRGRLRARIEHDWVERFEISTPSARVVDLGTDFEVIAFDAAQTAVHVIEGKVEVAPRSAQQAGESRRLNAGEAVLLDARQSSIQPLNDARVSALFPAKGPAAWKPLTDSRLPVKERLVVHLDAGNLNGAENAGLSGGELVRAWRNLAPPESSLGHFFGSATLLSEKSGRPVLHFNGSSDCFRNPQTLANSRDQSLTLFVVAKSESPQRGHLVATHRSNHDKRGWSLCFSGEQGALFYHTMFPHGMVQLPVPWEEMVLLQAERIAHGDQRRLTLRANGGVPAAAPDTRLLPARGGTLVGGPFRFFQGQIAEIVIYDRLLTPDEAKQVQQHLSEKYRIPLVPHEIEHEGSAASTGA